jgi:PAS domain S-box-containing protein
MSNAGHDDHYRALFLQSRDAIVLLREDGSVVDANPAAFALFGIPDDTPLTLHGADFWVDLAEREELHRRVAKAGFVRDFPARLRRMDGAELECLVTGSLCELPYGRRVFQSIIRDETERLQSELALRERIKELDCLYGVSRSLNRLEGDWEGACREIAALLPGGFQHPTLCGARVLIGSASAATDGFRETPWMLRQPIGTEADAVGEIAIAYQAPMSFLDEEFALVAGICDRIADAFKRSSAEKALEQREAHFRALIEGVSDMITIVDEQGIVRFASPSCVAFTGIAPEDAVGSRVLDFVHPDDLERVAQALSGPVGVEQRVEYRARGMDGNWGWFETKSRNDPVLGGHLAVTRSMTERRELEDQLRHAQKMEAVGRLAGGVAHDINNVLTVIDTNAELLHDAIADRPDVVEDLREIQKASAHAAMLTRQLLAFSRKQVIAPKLLTLDPLIQDLVDMLRRLIGTGVTLTTDFCASSARVLADSSQIEQVILNLVINARDAMPNGGELVIRTDRVESNGSWVRISITDHGVGMDEATRERIFEPFFTTKPNGTGLGLATVYGIVRQSGGELEVESEPGRGTTMRVLLPEACAARQTSAPGVRPSLSASL